MDLSLAISLFVLLSAPFVGSFLNLVAERWPKGESFVYGPSRCEHCGHVLEWSDLVPLTSWFLVRGRCRYCHGPISILHPVAELSALGIAIWSMAEFSGPVSWISTLFGWTLLTIALIDFRWMWLPNGLTLLLALAGLAS